MEKKGFRGSVLLVEHNNYDMAKTMKGGLLLNEEILQLVNTFPLNLKIYLIKEYNLDISRYKDRRNNNILHLMVCQNHIEISIFKEECPKMFKA